MQDVSMFNTLVSRLTPEQLAAAKQLTGPVMVIAGPGTGKTTLLTARLGFLLQTTDDQVNPANILCLTYTDNAAREMKERLVALIGPTGEKVKICTFHAFCFEIIESHSSLFSDEKLEPATELERKLLINYIIENLPPENILQNYSLNAKYEVKTLLGLFTEIKKENIDVDATILQCKSRIGSLPTLPEFLYKNSRKGLYNAGDPKKDAIAKEVGRLNKIIARLELFKEYERRMRDAGKYDFEDMLLWVIEKLDTNEELLLTLKERFQYILVDEFQDTNGAQFRILKYLIADADNNPNVFCVGDEDQCIFEFQGARIENLQSFRTQYAEHLRTHVLTNNFRSTQPILESAMNVIANNKMRLANDKKLVACRQIHSPVQPSVVSFETSLHELAWVANKVEELCQQGAKPSDIAVLNLRNNSLLEFSRYLDALKIPYSISRKQNALENFCVVQLLQIISYLEAEATTPGRSDHLLYHILHQHIFKVDAADLQRLSLMMCRQNSLWADVIGDEELLSKAKLKAPHKVVEVFNLLCSWRKDVFNMPVYHLITRIIEDIQLYGYLKNCKNGLTDTFAIISFVEFVKAESERKSDFSIAYLLDTVNKMLQFEVSIPVEIQSNEKGVTLSTLHSSKGSEYKYVFVTGCDDKAWVNKPNDSSLQVKPTSDLEKESRRRLFYVACTRAKDELYITYNNSPSCFVTEMNIEVQSPVIDDTDIARYMMLQPGENPVVITIHEKEMLRGLVKNFKLSASSLETFQRCKIEFYFTCLLKVPAGDTAYQVYGKAVHAALAQAFDEAKKDSKGEFPSVNSFIQYFKERMEEGRNQITPDDYSRMLARGNKFLPGFYESHSRSGWSADSQSEVSISTHFSGVPITGRIDNVENIGGNQYHIRDFKTGQRNLDKKVGEIDAQMVFYKILWESAGKGTIIRATFEYARPDGKGKFPVHEAKLSDDAVESMKKSIPEVYAQILNLDFSTGCGKPDCSWCRLVKENSLLTDVTVTVS